MRREAHHIRDALHRSSQWLDTLHYAALAEDRSRYRQAAIDRQPD
jgi:hypothetical protein